MKTIDYGSRTFATEESWNNVNPEHKRPGITKIVRRLLNENHDWSLDRAAARAKTLWGQGVRE